MHKHRENHQIEYEFDLTWAPIRNGEFWVTNLKDSLMTSNSEKRKNSRLTS